MINYEKYQGPATDNVIMGTDAAAELTWQSRCTIIGARVPAPNADDTVRIGTGDIYLEIDRKGARIVGGDADEAAVAFLEAISESAERIVEYLRGRIEAEGLD